MGPTTSLTKDGDVFPSYKLDDPVQKNKNKVKYRTHQWASCISLFFVFIGFTLQFFGGFKNLGWSDLGFTTAMFSFNCLLQQW